MEVEIRDLCGKEPGQSGGSGRSSVARLKQERLIPPVGCLPGPASTKSTLSALSDCLSTSPQMPLCVTDFLIPFIA